MNTTRLLIHNTTALHILNADELRVLVTFTRIFVRNLGGIRNVCGKQAIRSVDWQLAYPQQRLACLNQSRRPCRPCPELACCPVSAALSWVRCEVLGMVLVEFKGTSACTVKTQQHTKEHTHSTTETHVDTKVN